MDNQEIVEASANFWMKEMKAAEAEGDTERYQRAKKMFEVALAVMLDQSFRRALEIMNEENHLNIEIPPSLDSYLNGSDESGIDEDEWI